MKYSAVLNLVSFSFPLPLAPSPPPLFSPIGQRKSFKTQSTSPPFAQLWGRELQLTMGQTQEDHSLFDLFCYATAAAADPIKSRIDLTTNRRCSFRSLTSCPVRSEVFPTRETNVRFIFRVMTAGASVNRACPLPPLIGFAPPSTVG